jgi:hypothetical protein
MIFGEGEGIRRWKEKGYHHHGDYRGGCMCMLKLFDPDSSPGSHLHIIRMMLK